LAAGDRSRRLLIKIQDALGDPVGTDIGFQENVYDALNRTQLIILEGASAAQTKQTINVVGGTELYNLPSGFVAISAILPGTTTPLVKRNIQQVAEIKRQGTSLDNTTTDPVYYYIWNNQIGFLNPAGGAPSGAATVTVWGWATLADDLSQDMSDTVDPLVNRRWDTALYYGAMADLTGEQSWIVRFEQAFTRTRSFETGQRQIDYEIQPNTDYD